MIERAWGLGLALAGAVALGACGGGSSSADADAAIGGVDADEAVDATAAACDPAGDPAAVPLRGACPSERRLGGFLIEEQPRFAVVTGDVSNGTTPLTVFTVERTEGDCALVRRPNPFCNPACDTTETCSLEEVCVPAPRQQDVGPVAVEGLASCVAMAPRPPGNGYFQNGLPNPPFAAGGLVRLTTGAGPYGPLELHGVGVEPMAPLDARWMLVPGQALVIAWTPPTTPGRARVAFSMNIDQHGTSPLSIVCDVADTGTASVPAALIDDLFAAQSGFPSGSITRRTVDSQDVTDGCVDLAVGSTRPMAVCASGACSE